MNMHKHCQRELGTRINRMSMLSVCFSWFSTNIRVHLASIEICFHIIYVVFKPSEYYITLLWANRFSLRSYMHEQNPLNKSRSKCLYLKLYLIKFETDFFTDIS